MSIRYVSACCLAEAPQSSSVRSYPSEPGCKSLPIAAAVSKVNDYQFSSLFYDKSVGPDDGASTHGGLPKSMLLASIDAACTGFVQSNLGPRPCTLPGASQSVSLA